MFYEFLCNCIPNDGRVSYLSVPSSEIISNTIFKTRILFKNDEKWQGVCNLVIEFDIYYFTCYKYLSSEVKTLWSCYTFITVLNFCLWFCAIWLLKPWAQHRLSYIFIMRSAQSEYMMVMAHSRSGRKRTKLQN